VDAPVAVRRGEYPSRSTGGNVGIADSERFIPGSAALLTRDDLDEYPLLDVAIVAERTGFCPREFISKLPGLSGRNGFSDRDAKVSALCKDGISGRLSSLSTGSDGCSAIGFPSPFLPAFHPALFLFRSSSAIALLILTETICLRRLLTLRSQKPVRPPSSRGILPHKYRTKNRAARSKERNEKIQMMQVNSMPDRMTACRGSSLASARILSKKLLRELSKSFPCI
jgi:hypothetical protein